MPDTDERAIYIIKMKDQEKWKAQNMLQLYQDFADLGFPVENQITTKKTPGEDKSLDIRDPTALFALEKATSGFIGAWIPRERYFFGMRVRNRQVAEMDEVRRWIALAVQIAHDEMFDSNFMLQLHNTVKATIGFGTGCLYSEWDWKERCLNFADWHISFYTIKTNAHREVDTVILNYQRTARQLVDEYSDPGDDVVKAAEDIATESKLFSIIRVVRPRINRTYKFIDKTNMPFEDIHVCESEKKVIRESGYPRFPFAVPRWEVGSCEKLGRGRGVMMLSAIKELQQMRKDYMEMCNRYNRPPYEVVHNNVEGEVNMMPDGRNDVSEKGSINPLNPTLYGSAPITKDALEEQRNIIKEGFYTDIFSQFVSLKGDRRTTTEIELRYKEGLRQLISPVARQEVELFNAILENVIPLLIEWGRIPPPPPQLRGQEYSIEYMGELSMAMKEFQARGFERAMGMMGQIQPVFPAIFDYVDMGRTMPDVLTTYGMKSEHLATAEEIMAKQQKRNQDEQEQKAAMAAQVAGKAYKDTQQKPEEGSPAAELMGAEG
jgi:hypothetical protein